MLSDPSFEQENLLNAFQEQTLQHPQLFRLLIRSLYSLRHTYATFALTEGIDIHTLARQMGASIAMIERHYSKITPLISAEKLAY